jgi:uncharacterized membrane protein YoaK (UPF0700 family)
MNDDNLLSATAGYVDTLSFVSLFGLFTAHVTGNFVLIGGGVAGYGQGVFLKLMAFPAFILGVALSSFIIRGRNPETPMRGACMLYVVQALLLLAFCFAGINLGPRFSPESWAVVVCGMFGATAMGVQNAHSRLVARAGVPNASGNRSVRARRCRRSSRLQKLWLQGSTVAGSRARLAGNASMDAPGRGR